MGKIREEYLIELTKKIVRYNRYSEPFSALYSRIKDGKFKLNKAYDFVSTMNREKELKVVVDKIISIIFKPQIKSITNEVILRSELSGTISTDSFIKTTRDSQLWKRKNDKLTPEFVYSVENVDTIDTYENRFISLLVDEIHDELKAMMLHLTPLMETLEDLYQNNSLGFGKVSLVNDLSTLNYPYDNVLTKFKSTKSKAYQMAKTIEKRIKHIKGSEFYRFTSKKLDGRNVMPTNILIHNPLYNYCFRFYKDNYLKQEENNKFDVYYYNYVFLNFIKYFSSVKLTKASLTNSGNVYLDDNKRVHFDEISFKNGVFLFTLKEDKDNLGFYIESKLVNNSRRLDARVNPTYLSKNYILTSFAYSKNNEKTLHEILSKIEVNNKLLITMNNISGNYADTVNLSYFKNNQQDLINSIFKTFTLLFDCDLSLFKSKCPVCGDVNVSFDGYNYICRNCGASFSINKTSNGDYLWVKNLRRIY